MNRIRQLLTRRRLKSASLSVTACLLTLSFVSLWHGFMVARYGPSSTISARVGGGSMDIVWMPSDGTRRQWVFDHEPIGKDPIPILPYGQAARYSGPNGMKTGAWFVLVPLWMPDILLVVWTAWLWRRDRKPTLGQCHNCGYDLHGLNSGVVCPECGNPTGREA